MLAKVVALIGIGAVYGLISLVGSVAVGAVGLTLIDRPLFPSSAVVRSLALSLLVLGLWALIGLGIGILIPNQVAALLIGIGVAWIVEPLLGLGDGRLGVRARAHRRVHAVAGHQRGGQRHLAEPAMRCASSGGAVPWCSRPTPSRSPGSASGAPPGPTSADPGPCGGRWTDVGDGGRSAATTADRPPQRAHHSPCNGVPPQQRG